MADQFEGAAMTAAAVVEDEVRELVRRRGLDPIADPSAVRRLVEEVVADYDERSLDNGLPPISSPSETIRLVVDAVAGFGPLQRYLEDPDVEEIWINEPGRVFVARRGCSELTTTILTAEEIRDLVERMLRSSGRRVDVSTPFVDATLPDGSRLHVVVPDITREHLAVNIRKFIVRAGHLDELVRIGTLTGAAARFLEASVVSGLNILVAGGTQAGKTTLLNCVAAAIPAQERVVTAEEVFELRVPLPDVVAMQTRQPSLEGTGEVRLRRLIKEALRMRPSRIIVGEVRQEECLDLLIALNSGVPGMATLHANTAREAVTKMCTLPLLAGENVTSAFVVPTVAACIDLVVYIRAERDGARRIHEIISVPGRVDDGIIETAEIFVRKDGQLARASGYPPRPEQFAAAGFDLGELLHAGLPAGVESAARSSPSPAGRHSTRAAHVATDMRWRSLATGINNGLSSNAGGHPGRAKERDCRSTRLGEHGWS
jgi:pilus assembly protein CpaF